MIELLESMGELCRVKLKEPSDQGPGVVAQWGPSQDDKGELMRKRSVISRSLLPRSLPPVDALASAATSHSALMYIPTYLPMYTLLPTRRTRRKAVIMSFKAQSLKSHGEPRPLCTNQHGHRYQSTKGQRTRLRIGIRRELKTENREPPGARTNSPRLCC